MDKSQNNKDQNAESIPERNPSKAMDSKREVEQSPDEKTDQDFPGYPHYPAREDILNQEGEYIREDIDVENLPGPTNNTGVSQRFSTEESHSTEKDNAAGEKDAAR